MPLLRRLIISVLILGFVLIFINWPFSTDSDSTTKKKEGSKIAQSSDITDGKESSADDVKTDSNPEQSSDVELNELWT
ncbi:MAG: hypothetical protein ACR2QW_00480, partial [bacterium]